MSSLGHMSYSTLQKVRLGLRPRVPRAKPAGAKPRVKALEPSQADVARSMAAEQEDDEERIAWALWFRTNVPAWIVSMVTHIVLLLALALMTIAVPEKPETKGLIVSTTEPVLEQEEILDDIELDPMETDLEENFDPAEVADIEAVEVSEPGALGEAPQIEPVDTAFAGPLTGSATDWAEIGTELGESDKGVGKDGLGPPVSFFGVKTVGNRFMFVVDNSNSMNKGRFETALAELYKAIYKLNANQEFYIIFYSDTAYPLFYPYTAKTWVKATAQNKAKLRTWLMGVHRCLRTNGLEAMNLAFRMKPDVLYLLGDGAFGDKTIPTVLATKNDKMVIHTLGFNLVKGRAEFIAVAKKFKGTFTDVQVTPSMVLRAKQLKRPKNNKQNGVWGVKLGNGPKKKPKK